MFNEPAFTPPFTPKCGSCVLAVANKKRAAVKKIIFFIKLF
jgi:hypothetical protein